MSTADPDPSIDPAREDVKWDTDIDPVSSARMAAGFVAVVAIVPVEELYGPFILLVDTCRAQ